MDRHRTSDPHVLISYKEAQSLKYPMAITDFCQNKHFVNIIIQPFTKQGISFFPIFVSWSPAEVCGFVQENIPSC